MATRLSPFVTAPSVWQTPVQVWFPLIWETAQQHYRAALLKTFAVDVPFCATLLGSVELSEWRSIGQSRYGGRRVPGLGTASGIPRNTLTPPDVLGSHAEGMPDGMICKHRAMIELAFLEVKMWSEEKAGRSYFVESLHGEGSPLTGVQPTGSDS